MRDFPPAHPGEILLEELLKPNRLEKEVKTFDPAVSYSSPLSNPPFFEAQISLLLI